MTLTAPQLRSTAALVAAVPGLRARLADATGTCVEVGPDGDGHLRAQAFHDIVRDAHARGEVLAATELTVEGLDAATGLVHHAGARWFVSPLPARRTVACLRESGHTPAPLQAMVRGDDELGVSVVRIADRSGALDPAAIDAAAVSARAACLVAHLVSTTHAADAGSGTAEAAPDLAARHAITNDPDHPSH
ncbi:hypothetical protein [Demequina activiva]|uniref:Uncharacterized protein n=1 Tax=Demequina activiva TaxID=1582364 RepID=A0A919PZN1_9MICO|nr:hypothetical protein [Demequina activiva]GIG53625.1 hypothetical protein Dac01nite_03770 [Demequina activiva]